MHRTNPFIPLTSFLIISLLSGLLPNMLLGQMSATEVINRSIQYHDPKGILEDEKISMHFIETRPNGSDRKSDVTIDLAKELYIINREVDNHHVSMKWQKNKSQFKLDASSKLNIEQIEEYNLNDERLHKMKDYYRYLWHLPMTLKDPGTIISDKVQSVLFNDQESLEIKTTYDPKVGADIWYFYFNPETYALIGYRFYHDESANDGEYILLTEEYQSGELRLPKKRAWYMHKDDKYLGEDILSSIQIK
ncbi:MAG: hypothetical protein ACI9FN_001241 [Saprospiraceae bacterium]|jgi:hypothetical protein